MLTPNMIGMGAPKVKDWLIAEMTYLGRKDTFGHYLHSCEWSSDGTYFYYTNTAQDYVYRSTASTAFLISSITLPAGQTIDISGVAGVAVSLRFKNNGQRFAVINYSTDDWHEWTGTAGNAWNPSGMSYTGQLTVNAAITVPYGFAWRPDETKAVVCCLGTNKLYQYDCSSAGQIPSLSYANKVFDFATESGTTPYSVWWGGATGQYLYVLGDNRKVYQYTLSDTSDITTATRLAVLDLTSYFDSYNALGMSMSPDGKNLYVGGYKASDGANKVIQFSV